ncbi:putative arabinose efflux permease, MFS family [Actinokineospora diospyrosa]|uniref:Arabinose efflux permease, MFS family n=1 Tax=Actinokineospora diospyrosa TaxID=103728 RepID=A0ABT1IE28_9PSEU|nr:putative arabinose efflux permease, MFS family [Actinokineospora diospyrosa]
MRPDTAAAPRTLLAVLAGAMLLDALEVSIVLPVLPSAEADRGTAHWLMSGFAAGFALLLAVGGRLVARLGRRRTYLAALAGFAVASVAAGLVEDTGWLVATRVAQGMGAALTAPAGLAIIATTFPAGAARRRAVAVYSLFGAGGFTAGLLLSGALALAHWRWVLVFPAPVALVLAVLATRVLPHDTLGAGRGTTVDRLPHRAPQVRAAIGAALLNGSYLALLVLTTFTTHTAFGWAPWRTALALLPACVPLACSSLFGADLVGRFGAPRLIAAGAACASAGYLLRLTTPESYLSGVLPTLLLVGAGFTLSFAALNTQAVDGVPAADTGRAVAFYQCCVQCGAVLLLTVTAATATALPIVAGAGVLALAVALTGLATPPHPTTEAHDGRLP